MEPGWGINDHAKDGYILVSVSIPELKTVVVGLEGLKLKRKVDKSICTLDIKFEEDQVDLDAELQKGTKAGTKYHLSVEKKKLNVVTVPPPPDSYYKVEDGLVRIFVKK